MELKKDYVKFQKEIARRGIEYLIHFTPTINLYGILEQGRLMSRKILESLDIQKFDISDYVEFPDKIRYDDKNFINLSISKPNIFLLNRFKEQTKDFPDIGWCVLKIAPKHIYVKETKFAVTNAASKDANSIGITGDIEKFKMLFAERININKDGIRDSRIAPKFPTNVQAEVLVKDEIPVASVIEVCFDSQENLASAKAALAEFNTTNFVVDKKIFSPNRVI